MRTPGSMGPRRSKMLRAAPSDGSLFLASEQAAELYVNEVLDGRGNIQYLDRSGSVSALVEVEVDAEYVPDHNQLFQQEDPHGS